MTVEAIGIVAVLIGLIALYRDQSFIIYIFVCSTLLGSASALILDSLGGASISPATLMLGFVAYRFLKDKDVARGAVESLSFGRPGFWLALTVVIGLAMAFLMPRLLGGEMYVYPARSQSPYTELLWPSTSNLTQSVYLVGDFICFVIVSGFASTGPGTRILLKAGLIAAAMNLVFAALDLLTYYTNTAEVMSFIRNATYVIFADDQSAGFKRIIGAFTESSAFGASTLGYFALTLRLWLLGIYPRFTFVVSLLSLLSVLFATSTTAYVGLAIYLGLLYCELIVRAISRSLTPQMLFVIWGAPLLLLIMVLAIALSDTYWAYFSNLADTFVFNKLNTASGQERSALNTQALQSFFNSYGFGVGNGSVRASSFLIAVLANLGILGAVPLAMFLISVMCSPSGWNAQDPLEYPFRLGAKSMCLAWLITSSISNSQIDLGLGFYIFAASACANAAPLPVRVSDLQSHGANRSRTVVNSG